MGSRHGANRVPPESSYQSGKPSPGSTAADTAAAITGAGGEALVCAGSVTEYGFGEHFVATATHVNTDQPLAAWLHQHARSGDTLVVAFGHADLHTTTGLPSPYSELWSLPVRVRDPQLTELARVLEGPRRPTWLITGPTLHEWGIQPAAAERAMAQHYRQVTVLAGRFRIASSRLPCV